MSTTDGTRSSVSGAPATAPAPERLRGSLGVWGIVFIVVAAASPLGVIGGPVALGIGLGNGTGLPAVYVATTIIVLLFAAGFTALTPYVPDAGAFYSYIGKGLGRIVGLGFSLVALLSYLTLEIAVYGLIGVGAQALIVSWGGPALHWSLWAFATFAVVTYFGHRNIDLSRNVLGILLLAEVAIVLVFDAVVIVRGGPEGLSTGIVDPTEILSGAPGIALLFALLSFIGFEATAVFRDEARDPERTVPRATYLSLLLIGGFYTLSSWSLITAWGDSQVVQRAVESSSTLLSDATQQYLGTAGAHIVQVLFVTSLFACILSFHNIVSRYGFTLARRGLLPARLAPVHRAHGSPHAASAVISGIVAVFLLGALALGLEPVDQFYTWLAGISTVGIVVLLLATSVAILAFFARQRRRGHLTTSVGRAFVAPALALLGLGVGFVLILRNLPGLVGDSTLVAAGVIVLLLAAFTIGALRAARRPDIRLD